MVPVPGARIEVWEADEDGFYDVQYDDNRVAGRAHLLSDDHGPVRLLAPDPHTISNPPRWPGRENARSHRTLSHACRTPAFHGHGPQLRTLITHIFVTGDRQLEIGDSVFGVKDSLIKGFIEQPAGSPTPDGRHLGDQTWARVRFDIVLAPTNA